MSNAGHQRRSMVDAFRTVYSLYGFRGLYRGLTVRSFLDFFFYTVCHLRFYIF